MHPPATLWLHRALACLPRIGPWGRRWGLSLCALLLSLPAVAAPDAAAHEVVHITHAQWQPEGALVWHPTPLPMPLAVDTSARVQVALPPRWAQAPALYLPAAGLGLRLSLNGHPVDALGAHPPAVERPFHTPRLLPLPAAGWRTGQANTLLLEVQARAGMRAGVSDLYIGPADALRPLWWQQALMQEAATLVTGAMGIALGLYVLLRWSRQHNLIEFAWFGLIFVIWGMRTLQSGLAQLPLPGDIHLIVRGLAGTWSAVLFALFALMLSRSEDAAYRAPPWLGLAFSAYGVGLSLMVLAIPTAWIEGPEMRWASAVGVGLTLWGQWRIGALAWKLRRIELWMPAVLIVVYMGLAALSFAAGPERFPFTEHLTHQYESAPLFLSAGWMLAHRYWRALGQARTLAGSLQEQVDAQRRELQHNFDQLREAEREQARAQERSRVMRDLHDGLGLHLVSAMRQVHSGAIQPDTLVSTLQDGMDELRVAIDSLDTGQRDPLTLLGTLRYRLAPRFQSLGLHLGWEVADDLPELPELTPAEALHLMRLAQEALGNALKHSGASAVRMQLQAEGQEGRLDICDNGRGFDPDAVGAGRGLHHLKTRAQALRGRVAITSSAEGTRVTLWWPIGVPAQG
jgi:signal transduction histidine kinase